MLRIALTLAVLPSSDWKPLFNGRNARRIVDGRELPLTRGRLQLESQGSEIYFRRIEIKRLSSLDGGR